MIRPLRSSDPAQIGGYRLLGRLGAGGMGVVYLGRSPGGRSVAVKVIRAQYADDEDFRLRFRREATVARQIRARWVVPVVDADTESETPWLATGYVIGPSLQQAVAGDGPLPAPTVRLLGEWLAETLAQVHQAGLVHRDVKPSNVLLAHDGPRLIDFGIARALDGTALTHTGAVVGSPGFLSPEQIGGGGGGVPVAEVGPPSDLFSLGSVLAFAVTGRRPFGEGEPASLMFRARYDPPDLVGVPEPLLTLLSACLAKSAADRPTAPELQAALVGEAPPPEGWLPGRITRLIAESAAELIDLDGPAAVVGSESPAGSVRSAEPDSLPGPVTQTPEPASDSPDIDEPREVADPARAEQPPEEQPVPASEPEPPAGPRFSRRRLLTLGGAASALTLGGGFGLWTARGKGGSGGNSGGAETYVIGLHADLTGPGAAVGKAQERGARLAVEQFNSRGERPFRLKLWAQDDEGQEKDAAAVARALVANTAVLAVIGPTSNTTALASAEIYDQAELATLVISAGSVDLMERKSQALVRVTPDDHVQAEVIIWATQIREARSVAVVDDASSYGRRVSQAVRVRPILQGLELGFQSVRDSDDYASAAAYASGMDAVVYAGSHQGAAQLATELAMGPYQGLVIGADQVRDPRFLDLAYSAADGWVLTSYATDTTSDSSVEVPALASRFSRFNSDYESRFEGWPEPYAVEAYDAVNLTAAVLGRHEGAKVTRSTLVRQLRATTFDGIAKKLAFTSGGDFKGDGTFLYRVRNERFEWLGNAADVDDL